MVCGKKKARRARARRARLTRRLELEPQSQADRPFRVRRITAAKNARDLSECARGKASVRVAKDRNVQDVRRVDPGLEMPLPAHRERAEHGEIEVLAARPVELVSPRVAEANAGYDRARIELGRREALAGSGAVSGDELSASRAAFATARAARALASAGVASAQATSASASSDLNATEALIRGTSISTAPDVTAARARGWVA